MTTEEIVKLLNDAKAYIEYGKALGSDELVERLNRLSELIKAHWS